MDWTVGVWWEQLLHKIPRDLQKGDKALRVSKENSGFKQIIQKLIYTPFPFFFFDIQKVQI